MERNGLDGQPLNVCVITYFMAPWVGTKIKTKRNDIFQFQGIIQVTPLRVLHLVQDGPLPVLVINCLIASISRVVTPVTNL